MLPMLAMPASAGATGASGLTLYTRARVADGLRQTEFALPVWHAALTEAPGTITVAYRAYRAGVTGGDFALALRAAMALEAAGAVPPDAQLLLVINELRSRDWSAARTRLAIVGRDPSFGFVAPIVAAWLPPGEPVTGGTGRNAYRVELDALRRLAEGDTVRGTTEVRSLWATDPYRANSLQIAAAATLARRKQHGAALGVLTREDPSVRAKRTLITSGRNPAFAVGTPAQATAFVLARMAGDLIVDNSARSAIMLARFATFADPENPRYALIAAGALAAGKRAELALSVAEPVRSDPVYGADAASLRVDLLEATGDIDGAVAEATARSRGSDNDRSRLGDIEARRGNYRAAAGHYQALVDTLGVEQSSAALTRAIANAYDQAGDWAKAKPFFERALILMPNDARLLNQYGFGMVVRGEQVSRAILLIERANAVQPGNAAIIDSLGYAELRRGRITRAIDLLEQARDLGAGEAEIGEHLGDAYWIVGRRFEARYAWRAAIQAADGARSARLTTKIDRGLD